MPGALSDARSECVVWHAVRCHRLHGVGSGMAGEVEADDVIVVEVEVMVE